MVMDGWITARQAAAILGVTWRYLSKMYREGKVKRRYFPEAANRWSPAYYSYEEIRELAHTSGRARRRKGQDVPGVNLAEETDWITMQEAAILLDVHVTRVWQLIHRGLLACRREGGQGKSVRVWLSRQQVEAHQHDRERLQGRDLYETRRRYHRPSTPPLTAEEEARLRSQEWLTAAEAARYLGVAPVTLYGYRACGRLRGHRLRRPLSSGLRMVFGRKDVEALKEDPQYQAYRARWRAAFTDEAMSERENARLNAVLERMIRVHGWDRSDYEPIYQASPGEVW